MKAKRTLAVVASLGMIVALSSCGKSSSTTASSSSAKHGGLKISVVTHGQASDPYWSVVKNGVAEGQTDTGDSVTYQAPQKFDMVEMSHLIDAEVAKKPDGLVISIPDANALKTSITAAVKAGIPVLVIDSGPDAAKSFGTLGFVGTTSYDAGVSAGKKFLGEGVKNVICLIHEQGNGDLEDRCRGLKVKLQTWLLTVRIQRMFSRKFKLHFQRATPRQFLLLVHLEQIQQSRQLQLRKRQVSSNLELSISLQRY